MTAHLELSPRIAECVIHRNHRPQPWTIQLHHIIPEGWTRHLGESQSRRIPLCPTGHDAIHVQIRNSLTGKADDFRRNAGSERLVSEALTFWAAHPQLAADGVEPV